MAENRLTVLAIVAVCAVSSLMGACGTAQKATGVNKREVQIPKEFKEEKPVSPAVPPPRMPDFVPASEDITPLKTRIVDVVARKTLLRDVLHVIANAVNLNLVMEKGVDPETEVNVTLKNVTAEFALKTIFFAVDYFYKVEDNLLIVKAMDTRIFELGHPPMTQAYTVDVGGDIMGGAMNINPSGSGASSTNMRGNISQSVKSDEAAFKFWDGVEKSLAAVLGQSDVSQTGAGTYTINRLTGTVYVTASKKALEKVDHYLKTVRKVIGRQVLIEAKVIEVSLQDDLQFGLDWSLVHNYINNAGRTTHSFNMSTSRFTDIVDGTGPVFSVIGSASLGPQGQLDYVLNALQQQGDVRTLSNPKLNIMNGQTAMLSVGRNQAYISKIETTISGAVSGSSSSGQTITYTVDTNSILSGTMLGIMPYINESGEISLTITPIISDLVKLTPTTIGNPSSTSSFQIQLPTVDLRELSTTVKVKNGEIIAIGGLISKKEKLSDNQVPFLGNVPYLGYLFKSRDKQEHRTELVIIIQPVLLNM